MLSDQDIAAIRTRADREWKASHQLQAGRKGRAAAPLTSGDVLALLAAYEEADAQADIAKARAKKAEEACDIVFEEAPSLRTEGMENFSGYYLSYDKFIARIRRAWPGQRCDYNEDPLELLTKLIEQRDDLVGQREAAVADAARSLAAWQRSELAVGVTAADLMHATEQVLEARDLLSCRLFWPLRLLWPRFSRVLASLRAEKGVVRQPVLGGRPDGEGPPGPPWVPSGPPQVG